MSITGPIEIANSALTAARKLHPEDISVGDAVTVGQVSYQFPSFVWCGVDQSILPADRIVRLVFLPTEFELLTVKSICVPFVFCKTLEGKHAVYDVRQVELMKLDQGFAATVREGRKQDTKADKTRKSKKKRKKKST